MFTIFKLAIVLGDIPAYMELPISNVFTFRGPLIESRPFVSFTIDPNGDTVRFGIISNGGASRGTFCVLDWAIASCTI